MSDQPKSTIIDIGAALKADDERHAAARKALTVTIENALGEGRPNQPGGKYWERPENQPTSFTFRLPEDEAHHERMAELCGKPDELRAYANELHVKLVAVEARAELAAKHFGRQRESAELVRLAERAGSRHQLVADHFLACGQGVATGIGPSEWATGLLAALDAFNAIELDDADFESAAREHGWKPVELGTPAPSPLLVLSWMRWAYDLGRHGRSGSLNGRALTAVLAAANLLDSMRKQGHDGDEEAGAHDENCDACAHEGAIAAIEHAASILRGPTTPERS
jgi:hypothetical protein